MENSGHTGIDGKDPKIEESPAGDAQVLPAEPEKPKQDDPIEPGFCGFDETGKYYVTKIDLRYGHLAIFGFLQNQAVDTLKMHMLAQRQSEQNKKIINPATKKGWGGRFNLFK